MYAPSSSSPSATFQPRAISYTLPLDTELSSSSSSATAANAVQYHAPFGGSGGTDTMTFEKIRRTLALSSTETGVSSSLNSSSSNNHTHSHTTNVSLKLSALSHVLTLISRPSNISGLLSNGVFTELVLNATGDDNSSVREASTRALSALTVSRAGRDYALQGDILPHMMKLISEELEKNEQVRINVLLTFLNMSSSTEGISHFLTRGIVPHLIRKVKNEPNLTCRTHVVELLCVIARTKEGWQEIMGENGKEKLEEEKEQSNTDSSKEGIVPIIASVLTEISSSSLTKQALTEITSSENKSTIPSQYKSLFTTLSSLCKLVSYISFLALEGKTTCVKQGIVPVLVELLTSPVVPVRVNASLALQNLTNCESGKKEAVRGKKNDVIEVLITCIKKKEEEEDEMVQCQAMQTVTNLAELTLVKQDERIRELVKDLSEMQKSSQSKKVQHAAKLAVEQITWQP